jgi:16S rRNA (cytosine1402-N4)-methyltransferase
LAEFIKEKMPGAHRSKIHPATRIFQALRIAVNDELATVEKTLPIAMDLLQSGGRLAVISFHSLEDRIVKHTFREASKTIVAPPGMASIEEKEAQVKLVTRKPITPTRAEVDSNPRSRSSKLRVVEKL